MRKYLPTIYFMIFLVLLALPSAGMLIKGPSESETGEELVMPSIRTEEGWNLNYLSDLGNVFEERFAFRQELVSAYSVISEKLFMTSTTNGVIAGEEGWLYYYDTLADFQRTNILTGRQLHNAARNLRLTSEYCANNGIDFLFVIAPNKNTLYPEYMPYYYVQGQGPSNRELLSDLLYGSGINYTDFGNYDTLTDPDAIYYFRRDSHWNNTGAAIVSDSILSSLGVTHHDYLSDEFTGEQIHEGDLDRMMHPSNVVPETDTIFASMPVFDYDSPVESNFDFRIGTSGQGTQNLLMYRDSFGSSLLPFMAEPFAHAFFSRSNSCQINDIVSVMPDFLVIEKAERFISQLCTSPSRLPAPLRELPQGAVEVTVEDLNLAEAGDYITVTGTLPEGSYSDDSLIYIVCGDLCFEAFPVSDIDAGTEGLQALLEKNLVSTDNMRVLIL